MIDFETDYLRVWVDQEVQLMHSEWLRRVSSEEYRKGNLLLLDMLRTHGTIYWIADSAKLGEISTEDQLWTLQEAVPQIISLNLRKLARLSGDDNVSFNKFENFVKKVGGSDLGDLEVRQYITYKEAADWIAGILP